MWYTNGELALWELIVHTEEYRLTFQSVRILKALSAAIQPGRLVWAYVDNSAVFAATGVPSTEFWWSHIINAVLIVE